MHGQQSDNCSNSGVTSPAMGKVLSDGDMPPDSSPHHQTSLVDRMNLPNTPSPYNLDRGSIGGVSSGDDSYGFDGTSEAKRKKGTGVAGKSIEEELCRICGDRASGYHYNALSCEGCKGFFRRSITKTANYVCKFGGNCEMDMWMRRKCQACRLRRCREVGMKEECLLSEDQCKARDARRKSKQKSVSVKKEVASPDSVEVADPFEMKSSYSYYIPPAVQSVALGDSSVDNPMLNLSQQHQDILRNLLVLQEKFEFPDEQDVTQATKAFDSPKNKEIVADTFFNTMAEMTVLITHLIVEFAKCLPGFTDLDKEDQIVLLKASSTEVIAIRAARCYDMETKSIVFANGQPCTLENMLVAGLGKYAELVYEFCHNMGVMQTDNAEYALMTAIAIFSERPGLKEKHRVEHLQSCYVDILQAYETAKRRRGGSALAKFLTRLSDLRTISLEHSKLLVDLQSLNISVPNLMNEVFVDPPL